MECGSHISLCHTLHFQPALQVISKSWREGPSRSRAGGILGVLCAADSASRAAILGWTLSKGFSPRGSTKWGGKFSFNTFFFFFFFASRTLGKTGERIRSGDFPGVQYNPGSGCCVRRRGMSHPRARLLGPSTWPKWTLHLPPWPFLPSLQLPFLLSPTTTNKMPSYPSAGGFRVGQALCVQLPS